MDWRFGDQGAAVLVAAQETVFRRGDDAIRAEHLLLGVLEQSDGVAVETAGHQGLTLDSVNRALSETSPPQGLAFETIPPFAAESQAVLEGASEQSLSRDASAVGPEHILLALLDSSSDRILAILDVVGADPGQLRVELLARMGEE